MDLDQEVESTNAMLHHAKDAPNYDVNEDEMAYRFSPEVYDRQQRIYPDGEPKEQDMASMDLESW